MGRQTLRGGGVHRHRFYTERKTSLQNAIVRAVKITQNGEALFKQKGKKEQLPQARIEPGCLEILYVVSIDIHERIGDLLHDAPCRRMVCPPMDQFKQRMKFGRVHNRSEKPRMALPFGSLA